MALVGLVELAVDRRARPVVLAACGSRPGRAGGAGTRPAPRGRTGARAAEEEALRVGGDEPLRQVGGLGEQEPVPGAAGEPGVGPGQHVGGGQDVEGGQRGDPPGVVEREPEPAARAAVVPGHGELWCPSSVIASTRSRAIARLETARRRASAASRAP